MKMNFMSVREAAKLWRVSERRVSKYCTDGRIPGLLRFSNSWAIPADAKKPTDPRKDGKTAEVVK